MINFFLDRPILAWVIAIGIMLSGVLAIGQLPVSQYPQVAPPSVSISAFYPGASAETVEDTVTQIIEQSLTGIDNIDYISASSSSSGSASVTLTFHTGTDPDFAQVQVQNKLQSAMPLLPGDVQQQGISVTKSSAGGFLMVAAFIAPGTEMDAFDVQDYVSSSVQPQISRLNGVGQVQLFGSPYAMRIWLQPERLAQFNLTPMDVVMAIRQQNARIAAGELGAAPAVADQQLNASLVVETRMETAEEFGSILVRVGSDGSTVRLRDVAIVELGGEDYLFKSEFSQSPAAGLAISLASGANALETAELIRERLHQLERAFPEGLEVHYPFDTTPFVELSIHEVVKTLIEAIILVFLVMLLFLQNFRATLIPTIAVPVVLLGSFAIMWAAGFSINTLTMFGLVLAIGLLVDDAIVVVENVERVMAEEGLPAKEATRKSMGQIRGALIGIAMVLSAVFIPMAFFGGSTGVIYRQFSITIVAAMVLSVLVALILTPALCATMLKQHSEPQLHTRGFFGLFNRVLNAGTAKYQWGVARMMKRPLRSLLVYLLLVAGMISLFDRLPGSFLPQEDQGYLFAQMVLPVGATVERSDEVMNQIEDYFLHSEAESVESVYSVIGFSFSGGGQNTGLIFVKLKDWKERKDHELRAQAVANRASGALWQIRDAMVFAFVPPPIMELGTSSGFNFQLQDLDGSGHEALMAARSQLLEMANQDPRLMGVRHNGQEDKPVLELDIDREKAMALGLTMSDINQTLSIGWASSYIDDFVLNGRVKRIYVQGEPGSRMLPQDINRWHVRNNQGEMVPFSAFATSSWAYEPPQLNRYNGLPSINITGEAAPGLSSGDAIQAMENLAARLPSGFGFEWTGMSLQELQSGDQAPMLYALSILVVFLCLAALYESWLVPVAVMLVVPLGVLGAVCFAMFRGLANDIYFQVGLLTTIGLSSKNAILIVEFARSLIDQGMGRFDATMKAVQMRLRPILMTSMAFMLGVTPLVLSDGAGSGSQNAIGTAVFGGMFSATLLAIYFVPVFVILVFSLARRGNP